MDNETGQGVTDTSTGTPDELLQAKQQIDRLKGTQAANDRALAGAKAQIEQLNAKLAEYESAVKARDEGMTVVTTEAATLKSRVAELEAVAQQVHKAQAEVERMKVVAEMAAANPLIAVLARTNALPQAETIDDFRAALTTISTGVQQYATDTTKNVLSGVLKPPAAVTEDTKTLSHQATALIRAGKEEEGLALWRRALEIK